MFNINFYNFGAVDVRRDEPQLSSDVPLKEFFEFLTAALQSPAPGVRIEVVSQLALTKNNRAIGLLVERLQTDESAMVREAAVSSLNRMKQIVWREPAEQQAKVTEALRGALNDSDSLVRLGSVVTIFDILGKNSSEHLILALKNSDSNVRRWAASTLASLKVTKAIKPLTEMLANEKDRITRSRFEYQLSILRAVPEEKIIQNPDCPETSCTAIEFRDTSHFTEIDCAGAEYYYTPSYNYSPSRHSWDRQGLAGTKLQTVTIKSYKDKFGVCHNEWPEGNTLVDFVRIYRPPSDMNQ